MSRLRITGGAARGRILRTPVGPGVRPTTERVREALFSVLGQDLSGERVLDAFGGAGLVGLEAWSRGAEVVVCERDRRTASALTRRGAEVGAVWKVVVGDVLRKGPTLGHFDGVFVDPPYADVDAYTRAADVLGPLAGDWYVAEAPEGLDLPDRVGELQLDRTRVYGASCLWIYLRLRQ